MSEQLNQDSNMQEKQPLTLPKNIRQMGQPGGKYNIYIEDYVYTYLHMFLKEKYKEDTLRAAVLVGSVQEQEEQVYTFISGAVACDFSWIHEGNEQQIRQLAEEHFQDTDILGWYVSCSGQDSHIHSVVKHHYAQMDLKAPKYFIYEDEQEKELEVYGWEQNALHKMSGYYIYYEKNPQMQEFLIQEKSAEQQKKALRPGEIPESRYMVTIPQQEESQTKRKPQKIVYAACAAVLIVLAATGVSQIGNYQNLKNFQETMSRLVNPESQSDNQQSLSIEAEEEHRTEMPEEVSPAPSETDTENAVKTDVSEEGAENSPADTDQTAEPDNNGTNEGAPEENTEQQSQEIPQDTAEQSEAKSASQQTNYYIVQKGDSLMSISRKIYQSTSMVDKIREANNIDNMDVIYEGQKLVLP